MGKVILAPSHHLTGGIDGERGGEEQGGILQRADGSPRIQIGAAIRTGDVAARVDFESHDGPAVIDAGAYRRAHVRRPSDELRELALSIKEGEGLGSRRAKSLGQGQGILWGQWRGIRSGRR